MSERILFLTGRLARESLSRELDRLKDPGFTFQVHDLGLKVAALMTAGMIRRRLADTMDADRILVPGLCSGELEPLEAHYGIPVQRGPKDLKDLPEFFGASGGARDLSGYSVRIFAEIVDAPRLSVAGIVDRARSYAGDGADVIDLGCLPEVDFPHLEASVQALQQEGFEVSVDSMAEEELLRGGRAGADFLLSLSESSLWIADEVGSVPVLIPEQGDDLDSLLRACALMEGQGRQYLADPILEPLHFGFCDSLVRYHELRRRLPDVSIMMGTGNLTELTDADTTGMTALLMGLVSELDVAAILTTQVSPHARTAVREVDLARRIMFAAKADGMLPRGFGDGLMALRDRRPFVHTTEEIAATARSISDPSFRIQVSEDGLHVYNREGLWCSHDPFELYPHLGVDSDGSHAFYLGVEMARAQIAWQLGKRYMQDQPLRWGCTVPEPDSRD